MATVDVESGEHSDGQGEDQEDVCLSCGTPKKVDDGKCESSLTVERNAEVVS